MSREINFLGRDGQHWRTSACTYLSLVVSFGLVFGMYQGQLSLLCEHRLLTLPNISEASGELQLITLSRMNVALDQYYLINLAWISDALDEHHLINLARIRDAPGKHYSAEHNLITLARISVALHEPYLNAVNKIKGRLR